MDYVKKCQQWREKQKNGKGDGIERIFKDEERGILYRDKNSLIPVDSFFFCQKENGMRTAEITYRRTADYSISSKWCIFIKDMRKVIFIDENEEGHAFGYNETDKAQSFVLYIRIGGSVRLMWANSASNRVNRAVDVCGDENPSDMDCLIDFMQIGKAAEKIIDKESGQ